MDKFWSTYYRGSICSAARETKPGKVRLFCDFMTQVLRPKI